MIHFALWWSNNDWLPWQRAYE